ncbi:amino acid adenylation domain-containing protein [Psychrobacillus glaciei]|uniref:Amino acid adenylation domain-containing protein n=1 Tax=Psychrobacillus glaciei TaxID=2283160 RepID=A0A5J6SQX9_9BACI|nr:non-ribosomal peptide synthetase [Psychrobacillus glaciei]QFG00376.1 amino acid adenylation domain-containing protein [Psychrobacillus glaciei]
MNNIESIPKLTPAQEGMLFHSVNEPEKNYYIAQKSFDLEGLLDIHILKESISHVHDRYDLLRSTIEWEGLSEPLRIIHKKMEIKWKEHNVEGDPRTKKRVVEKILDEDLSQRFNLSKEPLARWNLIQLNKNKYKLVFTYHHIILDSWSLEILFNEITRNYNELRKGKSLETKITKPFNSYGKWLDNKSKLEDELFWKKYLKGKYSPTSIKFFYNTAVNKNKTVNNSKSENISVQRYEGYKEKSLIINENLINKLKKISKEIPVSINSILLGAWALLLHTYSGDEDVIFGSTFSDRSEDLEDLESRIGLFINTVPIRSYFNKNQKIEEYLRDIHKFTKDVQKHQSFPPVLLKQLSEFSQKEALFNSIMFFEEFPDFSKEKWDGLDITNNQIKEFSRYPISLIITPELEGSNWNVKLKYNTIYLSDSEAKKVLKHFQTALISLTNNIGREVEEFSCLSEQEVQFILNEVSRGKDENTKIKDFYTIFKKSVSTYSDSYAIIDNTIKYTYGDIYISVNSITANLSSRGIKSGDIIGIYMDREANLLSCILALWKLGASFIPIDSDLNRERIQYIIKDSKIEHIIVGDRDLKGNLEFSNINMHLTEDLLVQKSTKPIPDLLIDLESPAYIIYTSGSTGNPKGVVVSHKNIGNYINFAAKNYNEDSGEGALLHTSIGFDLTLTSLLVPIAQGKIVFVSSSKAINNLSKDITSKKVNFTKLTPSHLKMLEYDSNLKEISLYCTKWILGGEALNYEMLQAWQLASKDNIFINEYGPTEATVGCTTYIADNRVLEGIVPVGKPIDNTQVYVLNKIGRPVPSGVLGEIYIGGLGVAKGYLNNPELTKEKFIYNPYIQNESKLYKTGDIGYYLEDGNLVYVRRNDDQLKVRGHRIEPAEIEKALLACEGILDSKVMSYKDNNNIEILVAYIITAEMKELKEIKSVLRHSLPEYMIPDKFIQMKEFPLTLNKKIDKDRLPKPGTNNNIKKMIKPKSIIEKEIADIWEKALEINEISIYDDFFEIGGHSLIAIKISWLLKEKYKVLIKVRDIFKYSTVVSISNYIEELLSKNKNEELLTIKAIRRQ